MVFYPTFLLSSDVPEGKSTKIWCKEIQKRDDWDLKYH